MVACTHLPGVKFYHGRQACGAGGAEPACRSLKLSKKADRAPCAVRILVLSPWVRSHGVPDPSLRSLVMKLIAHRGWSAGGDENTLAAFARAACDDRISGVEFDLDC